MKQICDLVHCSESVLGIILPSAQQQPNGVDCGVFAIAFAVDILSGFAEIRKRFDVKKWGCIFLNVWKKKNLHYF